MISRHDNVIHFNMLKTNPEFEKYLVNAALVDKILVDCNEKILKGFFISDGCRTIIHETNFQNYLEKYFGFRKAYCKLHIHYRFGIGNVIKFLYIFQKIFNKLDGIRIFHKINGILKMDRCKEKYNWKKGEAYHD